MIRSCFAVVLATAILSSCGGAPEPQATPTPTPSSSSPVVSSPSPSPQVSERLTTPATVKPKGAQTPSAKAYQPLVEAVLHSQRAVSESAESAVFSEAVASLFEREAWDELEALVTTIRRDRSTFSSPIRRLTAFYSALKRPRYLPYPQEAGVHLLRCKAWMKARPRSAAAKIATARSLIELSQQTNRVSTLELPNHVLPLIENPRGYARKYLQDAEKLGERNDPELYATWIDLERVDAGTDNKARTWLKKAESIDPSYFAASGQYARFLTERERRSDAWWDGVSNPDFIPMILETYLSKKKARLDFEKTRSAYAKLLKKFPNSTYVKNSYCKVSLRMRDRDMARQLLRDIGEQHEHFVWRLEELQNHRERLLGRDWSPEVAFPQKLPQLDDIARHPSAQKSTFHSQVRFLWRTERYAELEAIGQTLLQKDSRFPDQTRKVEEFLAVLAAADSRLQKKQNFEKTKEWRQQHPQSALAATLLLDQYVDKAWQSRGNGWAYQVSKRGWAGFGKNLREALQIIAASLETEQRLPATFYSTSITVAMGAGAPPEVTERLFEEGVALYPDSERIYSAMSVYLLPRWIGQPGDWEAFAKKQSREKGDYAYYLLYRACLNYSGGLEVKLSEQKARAGVIDLARKFGTPAARHQMLRFAVLTRDRTLAKQAFQSIGPNWDPQVLGSGYRFRRLRAWALFGKPFPQPPQRDKRRR